MRCEVKWGLAWRTEQAGCGSGSTHQPTAAAGDFPPFVRPPLVFSIPARWRDGGGAACRCCSRCVCICIRRYGFCLFNFSRCDFRDSGLYLSTSRPPFPRGFNEKGRRRAAPHPQAPSRGRRERPPN
ncbi:hypothetical protein BS78_01G383400 [Paspalum vaginatum]|nr:hypothetical protein BS78_01G383400 [Paspalum vaginatum]